MLDTDNRISYTSQQSGEYYIYLDNKFYCSCDNFKECREEIEELEEKIAKGEI